MSFCPTLGVGRIYSIYLFFIETEIKQSNGEFKNITEFLPILERAVIVYDCDLRFFSVLMFLILKSVF